MGIRVKTNVQALIAQRQLGNNRRLQAKSLERLSSGQRINRSSDDAAGLAVSERVRSKIASLGVAKRNASDGISYIQVAEGALAEITNNVVRMRELSSQAASDTIGVRERSFLDAEFQQLTKEVSRIAEATEFNGQKLLNADVVRPLNIFVGASNRGNVDGEAPEWDAETDPDIIQIDMEKMQNLRGVMEEVTNVGLTLSPEGGDATELGVDGTHDLFNRLDNALDSIAEYRAVLGSVQSRINSTISNIEISTENLEAARSRIRDADYATETTALTQSNILSAAGSSVLLQANQRPEVVLQLLR